MDLCSRSKGNAMAGNLDLEVISHSVITQWEAVEGNVNSIRDTSLKGAYIRYSDWMHLEVQKF